jgi:hypothetical protein
VTTSSLIDAVMREWDYSSSSSDNTAVRTKILDKAQEVSDEDWEEFDGASWQIKSTSAISTAAGASDADLPTDFWKMGDSGGVFIAVASDDIRRLTYLPPGELREMQRDNGTTRGVPEAYTVVLTEGATDIVQEIQFDCLADAAYTLHIDYQWQGPTLVDATDSTNQLQWWPAMLHTMLLKGVLARTCRVMGDVSRQAQFESEHQRRKASAMSRWQHGQDDDQRIGRGGYSAWRMH